MITSILDEIARMIRILAWAVLGLIIAVVAVGSVYGMVLIIWELFTKIAVATGFLPLKLIKIVIGFLVVIKLLVWAFKREKDIDYI